MVTFGVSRMESSEETGYGQPSGTPPAPAPVTRLETTSEYLTMWLDHMRYRVRATTFESYEGLLRLHVLPYLGNKPLEELRGLEIQSLYSHLMAAGSKRFDGGLSARTVSHIHTLVVEALGQAVKW